MLQERCRDISSLDSNTSVCRERDVDAFGGVHDQDGRSNALRSDRYSYERNQCPACQIDAYLMDK